MSLQGSIAGLQNQIAELYLQFEQSFTENHLIRDLWGTMANDVSQQTRGLKALSHSFWTQFKNDSNGLSDETLKAVKQQIVEKTEDRSLRSCFERTLRVEEATILKLYVPIIRSLRRNWTDQALDFYIMVKAHLARIVRVTEAFSGDPAMIRRSHELLHTFEKEVQEPDTRDLEPQVKPRAARPVRKPARTLAKRVQSRHSRTKPMVEKISLQRRRARSR